MADSTKEQSRRGHGAAAPLHASRPARRHGRSRPALAVRGRALSPRLAPPPRPVLSCACHAIADPTAPAPHTRARSGRWLRQRLGGHAGVRPSSSAPTAALMELQLLAKHKLGKDLGQGERRRERMHFWVVSLLLRKMRPSFACSVGGRFFTVYDPFWVWVALWVGRWRQPHLAQLRSLAHRRLGPFHRGKHGPCGPFLRSAKSPRDDFFFF